MTLLTAYRYLSSYKSGIHNNLLCVTLYHTMPRSRYLILIACLLLSSCYRNENVQCFDSTVDIKLKGFVSNELSEIVLSAYREGGNFDAAYYINGGTSYYNQLRMYDEPTMVGLWLVDTLDYEVRIPAAGKTNRITEITRQPPHEESVRQSNFNKKLYTCTNRFLTYKLNGENREWPASDYQYIELEK